MKNALLLFLSVLIIGVATTFIVWNLREGEPHEDAKTIAVESVVTITESAPAGAVGVAKESESGMTDTASIERDVAKNEAETESELPAAKTGGDEPVEEDAAFQTWKTLAGSTFEARLIWVSTSGKALRFEEPDGSTFVYSTDHLEPEHHDVVHSMLIARGSGDGRVF